MDDSRVLSLTYSFRPAEHVEFVGPPALPIETEQFRGSLEGRALTLVPKVHFPDRDVARRAADLFVEGWQIAAGLESGRPVFELRFAGDEVAITPEQGRPTVQIRAVRPQYVKAHITLPSMKSLPSPPRGFQVTPDVRTLWVRYCGFAQGAEPLTTMGYACFTLLKGGESLRDAGRRLRISAKVLTNLRRLTSTRGDERTARKFTPETKPMDPAEEEWIKAAMKAIIRHLATPQPARGLVMGDLPSLP